MAETPNQSPRKKKISDEDIQVRPMKSEDIPKILELRRSTRSHDLIASSCVRSWSKVDPQGINVIENTSGDIIGTCSFVKQYDDLYYGGLYSVHEEYQGLGLGMTVWNACMKNVGSANAALNSLPGKTEMYRSKSGFSNVETEFTFIKHYTKERVKAENLSSELPKDVVIEPYQESHLADILAYDLALVGFKRELALKLSCLEENSKTFVALKNDECVGFGSIKTSDLGAGRVGPLYADDSAVAEALLRSLILSLPQVNSFAMVILSSNDKAKSLLKKLNCPMMEEQTRLYKGEKLYVNPEKIFAVFDCNFTLF